jgi:hypothetical protein
MHCGARSQLRKGQSVDSNYGWTTAACQRGGLQGRIAESLRCCIVRTASCVPGKRAHPPLGLVRGNPMRAHLCLQRMPRVNHE